MSSLDATMGNLNWTLSMRLEKIKNQYQRDLVPSRSSANYSPRRSQSSRLSGTSSWRRRPCRASATRTRQNERPVCAPDGCSVRDGCQTEGVAPERNLVVRSPPPSSPLPPLPPLPCRIHPHGSHRITIIAGQLSCYIFSTCV